MKMWKLDTHLNKITFAEYNQAAHGEWFETWTAAHHVLVRRADDRIERAKAELRSAKYAYTNVLRMREKE